MAATEHHNGAAPVEVESSQAARLLPDELVVYVLEFLGLADLRAAAGVGRQFYRSAWRAGLYIERTFLGDGQKDLATQAQTWTELVDYAVRKDLPLAFAFHHFLTEGSPQEHSIIMQVIQAIGRSLPVLVALSLKVDTSMFKDMCTALQLPSPRLRSLYLSPATWGTEDETNIPTGLFSGDAPRLCELGLGCPNLKSPAIPAFANVIRFSTYSWHNHPLLRLGMHFPKLAHLYVHSGGDEPTVPAPCIDLSGLTLRSLVFKDTRLFASAARRKSLEGRHVPVMHHFLHQTRNMDWHCPLSWPDSGGTIHLRVNVVNLGLSIFVVPTDRSWRRSYSFQLLDLGSPLPLSDMPGLCARLTYIRLHSDTVLAFLQCDGVCVALTRVRVDVAPAYGSPVPLFRRLARVELERTPRLHCPVLAVIALAAQGSATLAVDLRDVAFLCGALGAAEKPALELCRVVVECDRGALLGDLFSRVSHFPDGDMMPCAQFDSCVWDDHAAIVTDDYLRLSLAR